MLAAGDLDDGFGDLGKLTTSFSPLDDHANAAAVQSDGKIVVVGSTDAGPNFNFALARYNTDGSLDSSFDGDGKVTTPFGLSDDFATAVAVQEDGKIVVAGYTHDGTRFVFALARYNTDGMLDTTFDGDGKATAAFGSSNNFAQDLAIQSDGKIVVVGYSNIGGASDFAAARFNANGTLDTSFDSDGRVTTPIGPAGDFATSVAIQTDGKVVVTGFFESGISRDFALVRYNADGSLDTSFDEDGILMTLFGLGDDFAFSVAIQSDNKIVVAGLSSVGISVYKSALARYNEGGSLDDSFDGDGKAIIDVATTDGFALEMAIQGDGKIVVASSSNSGGNHDFAIARLNIDGSLDTDFAGDGIQTTPFGASHDYARGAVIQVDGKIVVAGFSDNGSSADFAVARYETVAEPILIADYNGDGKVSAADFTVWRDFFGALSILNRDPDNNGPVGEADFESWLENYGNELSEGAGADTLRPMDQGASETNSNILLALTELTPSKADPFGSSLLPEEMKVVASPRRITQRARYVRQSVADEKHPGETLDTSGDGIQSLADGNVRVIDGSLDVAFDQLFEFFGVDH